MGDTKYEVKKSSERQYRDFSKKRAQTEDAASSLSAALGAMKRAEGSLPPHVEQEVNQLRQELASIQQRVQNQVPSQVKKQAGAKHSLQTLNQDQHEHRPD